MPPVAARKIQCGARRLILVYAAARNHRMIDANRRIDRQYPDPLKREYASQPIQVQWRSRVNGALPLVDPRRMLELAHSPH